MSQYKELADRLSTFINDEAFLDAVDEAAAILRSLDAQPVAVVVDDGTEQGKAAWIPFNGHPLEVGTKLYAAPVAAQPQQAKPLSEEQVFALIEENTEWKPAAGVYRLNEVEFARAIEAAHGIKD